VNVKAGKGAAPVEEPLLEDALLRAIGREFLRLTRRRVQTPAGATLDQSSFRILWALTDMGPQTMGDLENVLQLEQSTISRQVRSAIDRGLLEFHSVPGTRRRLLAPTQLGERTYLEEGRLRADVFKKALAAFGPARFQALTAELTALNDALDHATAATPGLT
jgi:DNA-binding MarR family transcriptional regulator